MTCQATVDDHCCVILGQVCQWLTDDIKCGLHGEWGRLWDNPAWRAAPVGRFFARSWPEQRYDCSDWPQNIPSEMARQSGLCCWQETAVSL